MPQFLTTRRMHFGLVGRDEAKTFPVDYNTEPAEMCRNLTGNLTIIWVAGCTCRRQAFETIGKFSVLGKRLYRGVSSCCEMSGAELIYEDHCITW
jgi:hypothetical protein